MTKGHFLAEDLEGNCYRILFGEAEEQNSSSGSTPPRFVLEDGSSVQRVDNETFRIVGTGAYVSIVPG